MTWLMVAIIFANATNNDDDEHDNDPDNSIQFKVYSSICRLNSTSSYHKASAKTQMNRIKQFKCAKTKQKQCQAQVNIHVNGELGQKIGAEQFEWAVCWLYSP